VVAAGADVEQGEEVGRLAGARQHGGRAALELCYLGRDEVVRRVGEAGIEVAAGLEVEELAHRLGGRISERRALDDGDLTGLAVSRRVAALHALGVLLIIAHGNDSFQNGDKKTAFVSKL